MDKTRVFVTVVDDYHRGTSIGGVYTSTDAACEDFGQVLSDHVGYVDQRDKADTLPSGSVVCADDPQSGFEIVAWDVEGMVTPGENVYLVFAEDDNNDYPVVPIKGVFTSYEAARDCAVKAFEISAAYDCPEESGQVFGACVAPTNVRIERLELRAQGRPVLLYRLVEEHE